MISLDLKICMEEKISTESPYSIPVSDKDIKDFMKKFGGKIKEETIKPIK